VVVGRQIGLQPGAVTVVAPRSAQEAERLAVALTGDLLPPCVQAWLAEMHTHSMTVHITGEKAPALPALTEQEKLSLSQSVTSLSEVLRPARERGPELEFEIGKLFAGFNVYTGDEGKLKLQIAVWCEQQEEFPLFAIRKAVRWSVRGCQKLPTLAAFIADVRLAIGPGVPERRKQLMLLNASK
jgi:hypothetical protein